MVRLLLLDSFDWDGCGSLRLHHSIVRLLRSVALRPNGGEGSSQKNWNRGPSCDGNCVSLHRHTEHLISFDPGVSTGIGVIAQGLRVLSVLKCTNFGKAE